jgi:hypothetical protein
MSDYTEAIRSLPRWHPHPLVNSAISRVKTERWLITAVSDECECDSDDCRPPDCSFAYTTGLVMHSLPELAVYGLNARTSGRVLDELGDLLHGYQWSAIVAQGIELSLRALQAPVRLIELVDKSDLLITNELFPNSAALQVVWSDEHGRYPWMDDYALLPDDQQVKGVIPLGRQQPGGPHDIIHARGPNRAHRRQAHRRRK